LGEHPAPAPSLISAVHETTDRGDHEHKQPQLIVRPEADYKKMFELADAKIVAPHVAGPHGAFQIGATLDELEPMAQRYRQHELEIEKELNLAANKPPSPPSPLSPKPESAPKEDLLVLKTVPKPKRHYPEPTPRLSDPFEDA
jgi:hypothetical protein